MASPPLQLPPITRPARSPLVAAVLSLALPGVGHLYVGAVQLAAALLALNLLAPAALALLWAAGAMELSTWWWADRLVGLIVRLVAATLAMPLAFRSRAPAPPVAPGVYGLFIIGALLLGMLVSRQLQRWVPAPVELSAPAAGLEAGEYVQSTRVGVAAAPRPGRLAVYVVDVPDAAVSPAAPEKRDAFVGRVSGVSATTFTVEGRDAGIPLADYVGAPAGVVLSRGDGGVRWDRLGFAPR